MKLQGPENCGGLSHEGQSFEADEHGCIEIPDDNEPAIVAAFSHGFAQAAEAKKGKKG
jgi:hypothetical protein